jgi:hypothetical protein
MPFLRSTVEGSQPQPPHGILKYGYCFVRSESSPDDACYVDRGRSRGRGRIDAWFDVCRCSTGRHSGALHHLAVGEALRHHLLHPDPCLELLGLVLRLELDEVLVRLGQPDIVAVVPLVAGGGLGPLLLPVKFPCVAVNGTRMCHSEHVALGIFPLPWLATRQTYGCLLPQLLAGQTFLCLSLASCVSGT